MPTVATVRGDVDVRQLGRTLMHEHIVAVSAALARDRPEIAFPDGREATLDRLTDTLRQVREAGIETIVDLTLYGHDRDIPALVELVGRVDLNVVVATGFYTDDEPAKTWAVREGVAALTGGPSFAEQVMRADIVDGIGDTGVHAGIIKLVSDEQGMTDHVRGLFRAGARVAAETGVPITTHSHAPSRSGLDQLEALRADGADLDRVIIGHSGDTTDLDYLGQILDQGALIASDRFGFYTPESATMAERVETLRVLCERGYADRIVLGHDTMMHTDWFPPGFVGAAFPQWEPTHISRDVVPALLAAGVSQEHVDAMLVHTPARLLGGNS